MISQLFINNIAVIEKASIDFENGFTVLTGETGAGKSIIIDAINAVIGERTSRELIRTGAERASVSALFTDVDEDILKDIDELGFPLESDNTLLIQREIRLEGKSVCKINGSPATVTILKEIGPKLISIHGQHDSYDLLTGDVHIQYIDSFGELESLLAEYQNSYKQLLDVQKRLENLNTDETQKSRQIDLLKYQIKEIEDADIRIGEQDELIADRKTIRNSEKIADAIEKSKIVLNGDENENGVLTYLAEITNELDSLVEYMPEIKEISEKLHDAAYSLEDSEASLRNIHTDFDPNILDEIETRLDLIYHLSLKYGETEEDILDFLEKSKKELHEIEFADEEREELEEEYQKLKEKAISLAKEISAKRSSIAEDFAERVKHELQFLNMPGIEFVVDIERVPLYSFGCDKVEFLVSANKGEPPKPMTKIASGGELSRIMLAIKTVLAGKDKIETLIFDEIDTGISGEAANKVGQKLKEVSNDRQVICITHLAQIAALADNHLLIVKSEDAERTYTNVSELNLNDRKRELARIIGGNVITDTGLSMAEELLKKTVDK